MKHIAVFDLELTAWQGSAGRAWSEDWEEPEIVEIGAVKLAADDDLAEVDAMQVLVQPRINPELSDYFVALTGISQQRLAREAIDFASALARFHAFGGGCEQIYFFGSDEAKLRHNCRLNGLDYPFPDGCLIDAKPLIAAHLGRAPRGLSSAGLPELMAFPPPGPAHEALADSRCVAEALRRLRGAGAF